MAIPRCRWGRHPTRGELAFPLVSPGAKLGRPGQGFEAVLAAVDRQQIGHQLA